jgi:SAM-dependent methyltransferase
MTTIDYDSEQNTHSMAGAVTALNYLLEGLTYHSLLDVGCGPGMWVTAASNAGIPEVWGIDGIVPSNPLNPSIRFTQLDLTKDWNLGRQFDLAMCLEVAEHLDESYAFDLVANLTKHGNTIVFSAACPGQPGQHHVNCQWPSYWQNLFNKFGYACSDELRWRIWDVASIEPWYRQNVFVARKDEIAGSEPRIKAAIHPDMIHWMKATFSADAYPDHLSKIENGNQEIFWYLTTPFSAIAKKIGRFFNFKTTNKL